MGPVISVSASSGLVKNVTPDAEAAIGHAAVPDERLAAEAPVGRVEVELRPPRPGQRPFAFMTLDESLAWMTHLEHDRRLILPPGVFALEEVAEEPFLEAHAVVRVEVRPVLDSVHLEPFLLRGCANEPFEVAAWVQALASPVRRGE